MAFSQEHIAKHNILGVPVDDIAPQTVKRVLELMIDSKDTETVVTPNPEFILAAQYDGAVQEELQKASLSLPDGVGLQFAAVALSGEPIRYRQTGVDTAQVLLEVLNEKGGASVLLVGDDEHGTYAVRALTKASEALGKKYINTRFDIADPGRLEIGMYPEALVQKAIEEKYNAVLVALPMRMQLRAMEMHRAQGYRGVVMGIGGALDMISGSVMRAPKLFRTLGLEWLWRLVREPQRYKRIYQAVIVFPLKVAYATWENGQLFFATIRVLRYLLTGKYVRN